MSTEAPSTDEIVSDDSYDSFDGKLDAIIDNSRTFERENARLRDELAIQSNANVGLMEELAEAKRVIAWANNSLFGSHGFFLSVNGGPANEHHLDEAIEKIKTYGRTEYQRAEQAEARSLANEKDAEIGKAVNRAAAELPFGVDLEIALERGAGTVRLYLPDSDAAITDFGGDLTFSAEINAAIDEAIKNA